MQELKKITMELMDKLNQNWREAIQKGEKEGGIDFSVMFSKYSELVTKLDSAFRDAEERNKSKTSKKGALGGFFS